jgi:hypothetical protein
VLAGRALVHRGADAILAGREHASRQASESTFLDANKQDAQRRADRSEYRRLRRKRAIRVLVRQQHSGTAPASAQYVRFYLFANSDLGAVTAQFDGIYARRQVDANVLAQQSLQSVHFPLTHWFVKTWKLSCHVVFNGAGAVSGFQTNTNMGFNTVSLVHVGAEPKNRLRLNYNAIPNTARKRHGKCALLSCQRGHWHYAAVLGMG